MSADLADKYAAVFVEHGITWELLVEMDARDLFDLGIEQYTDRLSIISQAAQKMKRKLKTIKLLLVNNEFRKYFVIKAKFIIGDGLQTYDEDTKQAIQLAQKFLNTAEFSTIYENVLRSKDSLEMLRKVAIQYASRACSVETKN